MQTNKTIAGTIMPSGFTFQQVMLLNALRRQAKTGMLMTNPRVTGYTSFAKAVLAFIDRAVDHFGRITEPKHLTEDNAWIKDYNWDSDYRNRTYVYRNGITKEQRPLTEEQYRDNNYTLNTGE